MKYLKSFLGTLILLLLILLITAPVMAIPLLSGFVSLWFLYIKPVSEGGGDEPENLITLCKECHKEIHRELNLKKENSYDKNT